MTFVIAFLSPLLVALSVLLVFVMSHHAFRMRISKGDRYQQGDNLYKEIRKLVPETYLAQNVILRFKDGRSYAFEAVAVTGNGIYLVTIKNLPGPIKVHQRKGWSVEHDGGWEVFESPGAYVSRHFLRSYLRVNGITDQIPINTITIALTKHRVPSRNSDFKYVDGDIRIYKPHEVKDILRRGGPIPIEKRTRIASILKEAGCTTEQLKLNPDLEKFNPGIERWREPYWNRYKSIEHFMGIIMKDGSKQWGFLGAPITNVYDFNEIDRFIIHGKEYKKTAPLRIYTDDGMEYQYYEGMVRDDLPFPPEDVIFGYDRNGNKVYTKEYGELYEG